ncbi:hypothetical protein CFU_0719 [Collimonas fungivorans Ter331]|uniref:Uncharacterized protein n=1 Tax=Collimonas fungivorans (strain Ter331) TaxID=1005048 RepID=G0AF26_COLFT|nr:hypothetical protein CFU_0719 [Collimonas fungivorans Ter331]
MDAAQPAGNLSGSKSTDDRGYNQSAAAIIGV